MTHAAEAHESGTSPLTYARVGGALYLLIILGGIFGEVYVRSRLVVPGDATATADRIGDSELLWRVGMATEVSMLICATVLALILYVLLRPVSRDLALLALLFNLVTISIEATNELNLLATLLPLSSAGTLGSLDPGQLQALAYLSVASYTHGFGLSLMFFGCECLVLGHLIYRSGYLPRAIGVLMVLAGVSYLANSYALFVSPSLSGRLFPAAVLPAFVGETSLCLWLLVKGVNIERWRARAR